jgi:hypothetical protein
MTLRRSTRNVGKTVDYSMDSMSLFPEGPPANDLEVLIHSLNLQAFPSSAYARVDDILVYALFSTKRSPNYYRALLPATAGDGIDITRDEAISISNIVRAEVSHDEPTKEQCQVAASKISKIHRNILLEQDVPIFEQ